MPPPIKPVSSSVLLTGFDFARRSPPSRTSKEQPSSDPVRDVYKHLDALGEPTTSFNSTHDVYAPGTFLLEVGQWRSLESTIKQKANVPSQE